MKTLAENKYRSAFAHDILMVLRAVGFYAKLDRSGSKVRVRVHVGPRHADRFLLLIPARGEQYRVTQGDTRLDPLDARLGGDECPHDVAREFTARIATVLTF
ncbi:hypothetical protein [Micromonospora haikouensis]|uniref:hypothetical protein n=1 Tax=Micromonospora haikouensis TaxID=686309 RepID=UPI003D702F55